MLLSNARDGNMGIVYVIHGEHSSRGWESTIITLDEGGYRYLYVLTLILIS